MGTAVTDPVSKKVYDRRGSSDLEGLASATPNYHSRSLYLDRLFVALDASLVALSYACAVQMYRFYGTSNEISELAHIGLLPVIIAIFIIARLTMSASQSNLGRSFMHQALRIIGELTVTLIGLMVLIFLLRLEFVSRLTIVSFGFLASISVVLCRFILTKWYLSSNRVGAENSLNVLIIGSGRRARFLADRLRHIPAIKPNIVGFLDPLGQSAGRREEDNVLGHVDTISEVLRDNVIDEVIVAVPRAMLDDVSIIFSACEEEGVHLKFMADIHDFNAARTRLTRLGDIPLLSFEPVAQSESALVLKRIFDIIVTLVAIPILLPCLVVTAVAIKVDSRGPLIFTQTRVGLHKRPFQMFKFRSMVMDAEAKMKEIEHLNEADGPNFKIKDDPRVTRVGRFIRKTSIDELPQLFNVLKGDMSLVGPRPMSLRDVALFDRGIQRKRFSVRPGITCLWQISGRSDLSFDDWLRLDLAYIESWSLLEDIKILLLTIPVVLKRKGAS
jgi:exopolysaccharide biosynthesis polyprenyl glycosylphosphotransferase